MRRTGEEKNARSISNLEATVIKCLLTDPGLSDYLLPHMDIFESELGRKTANLAFEAYGLRGAFDRAERYDEHRKRKK